MLKNILKTTIRNFVKNKVFTTIYVAGLSIGIACTIMITLWVQDEISYDTFHENGKNIYRVMRENHYSGGEKSYTYVTTSKLAPALQADLPEIVNTARFHWQEEILFEIGANKIIEEGYRADGSIFEMFSFPLAEGNPKAALPDLHSIAISKTLAEKYFDGNSCLGEIIQIRDEGKIKDLKVTSVFEDIPKNSHLRFDFILPLQEFINNHEWADRWGSNSWCTYVQLVPNADVALVDNKISNFVDNYYDEASYELFLQPVEDIYLKSDYEEGKQAGGRIEFVQLFIYVALFVLLLACINFINLSTARAGRRAREVGIRKVVGAKRKTLIFQFISESFGVTIISALVAIGLVELFLPFFNQLTDKTIAVSYLSFSFVSLILAIIILTSLISGSYPALFLSSLLPIKVLKGNLKIRSSKIGLREVSVIFQFTLSVILIAGTIVIHNQIQFIRNKNIGINRANVVEFEIHDGIKNNFEAFKTELAGSPVITEKTFMDVHPLNVWNWTTSVDWEGKSPEEKISFGLISTDYNFTQTFGVELFDGRDFHPDYQTDESNFIINQKAAELMGLENPVGQTILLWENPGVVVGVVKDFHLTSLHNELSPLVIRLNPERAFLGYARIAPGSIEQGIDILKNVYERYEQNYPFNYSFLDMDFEAAYRSEMTIGKLATYFSILAIFISCLGLIGLAAYSAEQRSKEISVRKVLGSSVPGIIKLLSSEFVKSIIVANVIAWPIAYFIMNKWLNDFAYRIEVDYRVFILSGLIVLFIAVPTISIQALRAALANPIKSLRDE